MGSQGKVQGVPALSNALPIVFFAGGLLPTSASWEERQPKEDRKGQKGGGVMASPMLY